MKTIETKVKELISDATVEASAELFMRSMKLLLKGLNSRDKNEVKQRIKTIGKNLCENKACLYWSGSVIPSSVDTIPRKVVDLLKHTGDDCALKFSVIYSTAFLTGRITKHTVDDGWEMRLRGDLVKL